EHGAPQVAPAYRELDGNVALLALPIDERGPRDQVHVGEVLERDLGGRAGGRIGGWNGDAPDGREIAAVLARVTHHDGEVPIAAGLVQIPGAAAPDGGLDGRIDVTGRQVVARRAHPIDVDLHRRLTQ